MSPAQPERHFAGRAVNIVDGLRTPFLRMRGPRGPFSASDLALACGRALLARQPFGPEALDEVVLGCVGPGPDEANIARIVGLRLGAGHRVPAWTVQRNCASGLQALDSAALDIANGRSDLVLAGGTEAMSHAAVLLAPPLVDWLAGWRVARDWRARLRQLGRLRPAHLRPVVGLERALRDPVVGLSMGQTAEVIAERFGISRVAADAYAAQSHARVLAAREAGHLDEIEPLAGPDGRLHALDDGVREDSTPERLARLRPVFDPPTGRVTAGNSSQITDGAACLVLASDAAVAAHGLPVLAHIVDSEWAALDPAQMGLGPVHAMTPLLQRRGLGIDDIDYWEINEAFAAQVLACQAAWQDDAYCREALGLEGAFGRLPDERLNVDGGAVSVGHPVGASGARIVLHLARVLERTGARRGVASICIGGGQGGAMLIERPAGGEAA